MRTLYYDPKQRRKRRLADACPVMAEIINAFPRLYPGVLEYVNEAKQKENRQAGHATSSETKATSLQLICNGFVSSGPMFVATIHDAILCKPADAAFVSKVMDERFRTLDIGPTVMREPA